MIHFGGSAATSDAPTIANTISAFISSFPRAPQEDSTTRKPSQGEAADTTTRLRSRSVPARRAAPAPWLGSHRPSRTAPRPKSRSFILSLHSALESRGAKNCSVGWGVPVPVWSCGCEPLFSTPQIETSHEPPTYVGLPTEGPAAPSPGRPPRSAVLMHWLLHFRKGGGTKERIWFPSGCRSRKLY